MANNGNSSGPWGFDARTLALGLAATAVVLLIGILAIVGKPIPEALSNGAAILFGAVGGAYAVRPFESGSNSGGGNGKRLDAGGGRDSGGVKAS